MFGLIYPVARCIYTVLQAGRICHISVERSLLSITSIIKKTTANVERLRIYRSDKNMVISRFHLLYLFSVLHYLTLRRPVLEVVAKSSHAAARVLCKAPYILEFNPHPFYSFRRPKNQIRIRIAYGLDSPSLAGFWKKYRATARAVKKIKHNLLFYLLFIILYNT